MVVISTIHNNSRKIALRVRADLDDWCVEDNDRNGSSHISSDPIAHLSARLDPVGPFFYNNERTNATATSRSGGTETDTTAEMEKITETEGSERSGDEARRRGRGVKRQREISMRRVRAERREDGGQEVKGQEGSGWADLWPDEGRRGPCGNCAMPA